MALSMFLLKCNTHTFKYYLKHEIIKNGKSRLVIVLKMSYCLLPLGLLFVIIAANVSCIHCSYFLMQNLSCILTSETSSQS